MGSCIHKPLAIITGINIELRLYYCKYRKIGVSHNYMLKRFKNDQNICATSNAHKILATLFPKWKTKTIFRLESPKFINCYIKHSKTFNDFTGVSVYSTNCLSNSNQHWQCTLYANLLCSSKCTSTVHSNKRDRITTHISTHTSQSCSIALGICSQFNNRGWVMN